MQLLNIFVEGTQGTGKTTFADRFIQKYPEYHVYHEGDLNPIEMAWCSYLHEKDYTQVLERFPELSGQLQQYTLQEDEQCVVAFTRVRSEQKAFYELMESFEIHNARIPYQRFHNIIMKRYDRYHSVGNVFECSLFQNTIETLMLFYELSDDQVLAFYTEVYDILKDKKIRIVYLKSSDIGADIEKAGKERVDEAGNPVWYKGVLQYFRNSPYMKKYTDPQMSDYVRHLERRVYLEERILNEIMPGCAIIIPAKQYDLNELKIV